MDSWGERLQAATETGRPLDVTAGGSTDPAQAETWDPDRTLPADHLRKALTDPALRPDPRGLQLIGARITGTLDLQGVNLAYPLEMQRCSFTDKPNLERATLPTLSLTGSHLPGLGADQLLITHGQFDLVNITATGEVRAVGATINGQMRMTGAHLANEGGNSLSLDGARIVDGMFLNGGFTTTGEVRAVGASIGRQVSLIGAHLSNGSGLNLTSAHITGSLLLREGFTASGDVLASGATVDGPLVLAGPAALVRLEESTLASLRVYRGYSGPLNLAHTTIGVLEIDLDVDPQPGWWVGINLQSLLGTFATTAGAIAWLDKDFSIPLNGFNPHPWHQIADAHSRAGRTESATHLRFQAARRSTRAASGWRKPLWWASLVFTGYGYYPLLAAIWLSSAALAVALLVFYNPWAFDTTDAATKAAGLNPWLYGVGTVIPAGFTDQWVIKSWWIAGSILALRVFGWIQTALLLAGLTGLLRKN